MYNSGLLYICKRAALHLPHDTCSLSYDVSTHQLIRRSLDRPHKRRTTTSPSILRWARLRNISVQGWGMALLAFSQSTQKGSLTLAWIKRPCQTEHSEWSPLIVNTAKKQPVGKMICPVCRMQSFRLHLNLQCELSAFRCCVCGTYVQQTSTTLIPTEERASSVSGPVPATPREKTERTRQGPTNPRD